MTVELIKRPPRNDAHHYADWMELSALLSADGEISKSDAETLLIRTYDLEPPSPEDDVDEVSEIAPGISQQTSRAELLIGDAVRQLQRRVSDYDSNYPFSLSDDHVLRRCSLTEGRATYTAFLLASCKTWIGQSQLIEKMFEKLTADAVRAWLSPLFTVRACGTAASQGSRYSGQTMAAKVSLLAEDLRDTVVPGGGDQFRAGNSGDGGLDVVGWRPWKDKNDGSLAVFVQATTTPDFKSKWGDVHPDRWRLMLKLRSHPVPVLSIPFHFRSATGEWFQDNEVLSILLDRLRLVQLLSGTSSTAVVEFLERVKDVPLS